MLAIERLEIRWKSTKKNEKFTPSLARDEHSPACEQILAQKQHMSLRSPQTKRSPPSPIPTSPSSLPPASSRGGAQHHLRKERLLITKPLRGKMPTFLFLSHSLKREKHVPKLHFLAVRAWNRAQLSAAPAPLTLLRSTASVRLEKIPAHLAQPSPYPQCH